MNKRTIQTATHATLLFHVAIEPLAIVDGLGSSFWPRYFVVLGQSKGATDTSYIHGQRFEIKSPDLQFLASIVLPEDYGKRC